MLRAAGLHKLYYMQNFLAIVLSAVVSNSTNTHLKLLKWLLIEMLHDMHSWGQE